MINDGGAERMVKKRKVEWWQILAIVIMMLFLGVVFLFFFFIMNGEVLVNALNKATVKDGYAILSDVKAKYPDLAVTSYEQTDTAVKIDFKYYDSVLEKEISLLDLSYEIKEYMEDYLEEHPEDFIVKNDMEVELNFPEISFTNINIDGSKAGASFDNAVYSQLDMKLTDFMADIDFLKTASSLVIEDEGRLEFGDSDDFSFLSEIEGLEYFKLGESDLSKEKLEEIESICRENNIECHIN